MSAWAWTHAYTNLESQARFLSGSHVHVRQTFSLNFSTKVWKALTPSISNMEFSPFNMIAILNSFRTCNNAFIPSNQQNSCSLWTFYKFIIEREPGTGIRLRVLIKVIALSLSFSLPKNAQFSFFSFRVFSYFLIIPLPVLMQIYVSRERLRRLKQDVVAGVVWKREMWDKRRLTQVSQAFRLQLCFTLDLYYLFRILSYSKHTHSCFP